MSTTVETNAPAPFSPSAAGSNEDKKDAVQPAGRGSPDSAASDATPVTKNSAPPKRKKSDLHVMWETRTTSWKGSSPVAPPTTVRTTTTAWSKPAPRVVSPAVSSPIPPPPVNKQAPSDDELALLKKELEAIEAKKVDPNSLVPVVFSSSSPKTPPRDLDVMKHHVKSEAKNFEVSKTKAEDELALLKKELEELQGKTEEPKKELMPTQIKKKNVHSFWEQKTKDAPPVAVNKSIPLNQTARYTKSPPEKKEKELAEAGDDGATSDAADAKHVAGSVTVAAAATPQPPPAPQSASVVKSETATTEVASDGVTEEGSVDRSLDNDSITSGDTAQLMSEFRALVEKLVRKAMPSEIDHIDELIEEYDGREEELLEILSAMQEEGFKEGASREYGSAAGVTAVAGAATDVTAASVAGSHDGKLRLENISSFDSDMQVYEDDETARSFETADIQKNVGVANVKIKNTIKRIDANSIHEDENAEDVDFDTMSKEDSADIGNVIVKLPERRNSDIAKGEAAVVELEKSEREPCWKRNKAALLTLAIILILSGAGAAIGIILSSPPPMENTIEGVEFDTPLGTGRPLPESQGQLSPGISADDVDVPSTSEENLSSSCTSESSYSELPLQPGIEQLGGNNPLVAVDGTNAVVVTGSGYVSFYSLKGTTWERGETFGILASNGDVASVSISGDTAVIGLPKAAMSVGSNGPVTTGMVVTYERSPESSTWRQLKELVPDEYRQSALRYQNSDFGQSVSLYDDLLVVGAPSEEKNLGSATVFKKDGKGSWDQVVKLARGAGICKNADDIYFGYSVNVYKNMIAASADCEENIVLYEYDRSGGSLKSPQVLEWIDRNFGAVASIGMSGDYLIYSTVQGGLFIFHREGNAEFVLSQESTFDNQLNLFEYPIAASGNLFVLAVGNKFYLYTQAEQGATWKREPLTLATDGYFDAYVKAGLGVSNGNVLLGSNTDIEAYDLSKCLPELTIPEVLVPEPNCVVVSVTLDRYPTDTTWTIEDSDGNTFASNTPYEESMATTTQVDEVCDLSDGGYAFTIFDGYGDGVCCSWGEGSYTLSTKGGLTIASGGEFKASETTSFSMPFAGDSTVNKPTSPNNQTPAPTQLQSPAPTTKQPTAAPTNPPTPALTIQPTTVPTTQAPVQPTCTTIEISVTLDDYPQDTNWNVVDSSGGVAATSPAYDVSMKGSTQVESVCLLAGSYSFDIYDVYEDGICCSWGQGSYTLTSANGEVLATGGEWLGPSETKTFQLT